MSYLWKTSISILSRAISGPPCKVSVRKRQRCSALHHMLGLPLDARNCTARRWGRGALVLLHIHFSISFNALLNSCCHPRTIGGVVSPIEQAMAQEPIETIQSAWNHQAFLEASTKPPNKSDHSKKLQQDRKVHFRRLNHSFTNSIWQIQN